MTGRASFSRMGSGRWNMLSNICGYGMETRIKQITVTRYRRSIDDVVRLRIGADVVGGLHSGERSLQNGVALFSRKNQVGHIRFIKRIAREHLPFPHEELEQVVTDVFKLG